jgi:glutaredoxin 3
MQKNLRNRRAEVWTQSNCPACREAKLLLENSGIQYYEKMININGYTKKDLLERVPAARSVPQIFIDDEYVGGLKELKAKLFTHDNN